MTIPRALLWGLLIYRKHEAQYLEEDKDTTNGSFSYFFPGANWLTMEMDHC